MPIKKPVEMSNEELQKNISKLKGIMVAFLIFMLMLIGAGVYLTVTQKKFNAILSVGISFNVFLIVFYTQLVAFQKEQKSRGL